MNAHLHFKSRNSGRVSRRPMPRALRILQTASVCCVLTSLAACGATGSPDLDASTTLSEPVKSALIKKPGAPTPSSNQKLVAQARALAYADQAPRPEAAEPDFVALALRSRAQLPARNDVGPVAPRKPDAMSPEEMMSRLKALSVASRDPTSEPMDRPRGSLAEQRSSRPADELASDPIPGPEVSAPRAAMAPEEVMRRLKELGAGKNQTPTTVAAAEIASARQMQPNIANEKIALRAAELHARSPQRPERPITQDVSAFGSLPTVRPGAPVTSSYARALEAMREPAPRSIGAVPTTFARVGSL
jgi:hypothetical protein